MTLTLNPQSFSFVPTDEGTLNSQFPNGDISGTFATQVIASNSRDRAWNEHIPRAGVYDSTSNKTFIAYQGAATKPYMLEYDHSTNTFTAPFKLSDADPDGPNDSHGSPSITMNENEEVEVIWGSHNSDLMFARANTVNSITGGFTEQTLTNAAWTYAQIVATNNQRYIFGRHQVSGGNRPYVFSKWDGVNWGNRVTIVDIDQWVYPSDYEISSNGTKIYLAVIKRDGSSGDWDDPFVVVMDTADDSFAALNGTSLALPINETTLDAELRIEATVAIHPRVGLDETDNPNVLYWKDDGVTLTYRHARWNGTGYDFFTVASAPPLAEHGVELIVNSSSDMEAYITAASGDIEQHRFDGASWSFDKTIITSAQTQTSLFWRRCQRIENNPSNALKVLFQEIGPEDFTNDDRRALAWGTGVGS